MKKMCICEKAHKLTKKKICTSVSIEPANYSHSSVTSAYGWQEYVQPFNLPQATHLVSPVKERLFYIQIYTSITYS